MAEGIIKIEVFCESFIGLVLLIDWCFSIDFNWDSLLNCTLMLLFTRWFEISLNKKDAVNTIQVKIDNVVFTSYYTVKRISLMNLCCTKY